MLERYKKIVILKEYIEQTEQKVQQYNQQQGIDDSVPVNGVHQTNLGVFRAYLELYLKNLPVVNSDLTYMVRQLQPTEKGIPLEVYLSLIHICFIERYRNPGLSGEVSFLLLPDQWSESVEYQYFCRKEC